MAPEMQARRQSGSSQCRQVVEREMIPPCNSSTVQREMGRSFMQKGLYRVFRERMLGDAAHLAQVAADAGVFQWCSFRLIVFMVLILNPLPA
jgi:hypothetical protein